jgi:hypothetical protein
MCLKGSRPVKVGSRVEVITDRDAVIDSADSIYTRPTRSAHPSTYPATVTAMAEPNDETERAAA